MGRNPLYENTIFVHDHVLTVMRACMRPGMWDRCAAFVRGNDGKDRGEERRIDGLLIPVMFPVAMAG
jgi:hypothetical protein